MIPLVIIVVFPAGVILESSWSISQKFENGNGKKDPKQECKEWNGCWERHTLRRLTHAQEGDCMAWKWRLMEWQWVIVISQYLS
jgi:hypothetical protein